MTRIIYKAMYNGDEYEIREYPEPTPEVFPYLCFTANTANSTVQLTQDIILPLVQLETSTDGNTRTDYTIGDTITLTNEGDKIYWRNKSETPTGFSIDSIHYFFVMSGSIAGSGDINYLLCKNSTDTLSSSCYFQLFQNCTSLTTPPRLPSTTLADYCYAYMFYNCTGLTTVPELPATTLAENCYLYMFDECNSLTTLPELPATTLASNCYERMFNGCPGIKLSETQTGEYQTPYRIPSNGEGTGDGNMSNMFRYTGGTFKGTPSINTTYYTSNQVI